MRIVLKPGEKIEVAFHQTDGVIAVEFGTDAITATADLPDGHGRGGAGHFTIYHEQFNNPLPFRARR